MNESTTSTTNQFTDCASLAAIGVKLQQLDTRGWDFSPATFEKRV